MEYYKSTMDVDAESEAQLVDMASGWCWCLAQPCSPGRSICAMMRVGGKESRGKLGRHSALVSLSSRREPMAADDVSRNFTRVERKLPPIKQSMAVRDTVCKFF